MTVGRMSFLCWTVFLAMSLAFVPLAHAIDHIDGLPAHTVLAVVVVVLLWWGPFGYGMYLAMAAIGNGDRRLLARGVPGTALVLAARPSRMVIQSGGFAWQGSRVYKYRLRVSVPGRAPYETVCRICEGGIGEGATVDVAVAPHNRKRVTIDVGQRRRKVSTPEMEAAIEAFSAVFADTGARTGPVEPEPEPEPETETDAVPAEPPSPGTERIHQLVELARLHREGDLNDAEYAAEKARIIES